MVSYFRLYLRGPANIVRVGALLDVVHENGNFGNVSNGVVVALVSCPKSGIPAFASGGLD